MSNLKIYKKDGKYYYKDNGVINEVSFGGTVSPSEIASAVEAYLIENPPKSSGGLSQAQVLARGLGA